MWKWLFRMLLEVYNVEFIFYHKHVAIGKCPNCILVLFFVFGYVFMTFEHLVFLLNICLVWLNMMIIFTCSWLFMVMSFKLNYFDDIWLVVCIFIWLLWMTFWIIWHPMKYYSSKFDKWLKLSCLIVFYSIVWCVLVLYT